jgi:putative ABC transport system permease protein
MEIRPIISALMRSKVAMILIGLQVALTLAIVCNSLFIINQRLQKMGRPSGMNEVDTFTLQSFGFGQGFDPKTTGEADLQLLRSLPGVVAAAETNTLPMSNGGWGSGLSLKPEQTKSSAETAFYMADDQTLNAFGLTLVAGRNFTPEEIQNMTFNAFKTPPVILVTRELGLKLFPDGDALGKQVYSEKQPTTIVGIVERLQKPWVDNLDVENSTLLPVHLPYGNSTRYLVRAEPGRRDEIMKLAETKLAESNHSRIVRSIRTIEKIRRDAYASDRAMAIILGGVIISLLTITALGIVGMASFWVAQRTKQIGTRRALGATRGSILRYFLTENFLITTAGLLLGGVLTYALSFWLLTHIDGAKLLPWHYVPIGFVCLWVLGQIAVLGPAMRASRVSPAVATRSI